MELEITPEPTDEERAAIFAALAADPAPSPAEPPQWADEEDAEP